MHKKKKRLIIRTVILSVLVLTLIGVLYVNFSSEQPVVAEGMKHQILSLNDWTLKAKRLN